jgi:hypothetical protein
VLEITAAWKKASSGPSATQDSVEPKISDDVVDLRVVVPVLGLVARSDSEVDRLLNVHLVVLGGPDGQRPHLHKAGGTGLVCLQARVELEAEQPDRRELVCNRVVDQAERGRRLGRCP